METVVVIRKSSKVDKKYEAVIDGRKTVSFVANVIPILLFIKIMKGSRDIFRGIKVMKIGVRRELILLDFTLNMSLQKSVTDLNKKYKDVKFGLKK